MTRPRQARRLMIIIDTAERIDRLLPQLTELDRPGQISEAAGS